MVYLKHFYDSLTLNLVCDLINVKTLCDIGSGAGFPGLVIKIFFPSIDVTLVDSTTKRVAFLNEVITTLKLYGIRIINERAEKFAVNHREQFDIVVARAVAKLNILSELCIPLVKVNGLFIAMKGISDEEVNLSEVGINKLGGKISEVKKFMLPIEHSSRSLIKIIKIAPTKPNYPRKFEEIKKKPL